MTGPHPSPAWSISVDGTDITRSISDRLSSLTLTDNRGFEADQLDLVLDDSDGSLDLPPRKAVIRLALGWAGEGIVDKGSYTVDEIEHAGTPDQLTIRARSADLDGGLMTQMERSFHGKTVSDIVCTVADECGLEPAVSPGLAGKVVDHIDQTNESSANLLTRLAGLFDAMATVKAGRLVFSGVGAGLSASGRRISTVVIDRQSGDSHRFGIADRETYTAVRANYYDTAAGKKGEVLWSKAEEDIESGKRRPVAAPTETPTAQFYAVAKPQKTRAKAQRLAMKEWKARAKRADFRAKYAGVKVPYDDRVLKVQGEASYGRADEEKARSSAARLAERDAAKVAGAPKSGIDHSADNVKTLRHVYASHENAKRAARTEFKKLQRGVATFSITLARGRPELIPETPATVRGFKPAIDSTDWIITRATHNVTDAGYTTAIELEIRATEIPG